MKLKISLILFFLGTLLPITLAANEVHYGMRAKPSGSSGIFLNSGQTLGNASSSDVALGDLDGDGDLDAFVAHGEFETGLPNQVWFNLHDFLYLPYHLNDSG